MAHICKQCDKKYSSYKSLWFHNYKYHKIVVNPIVNIVNIPVNNNVNCKFCNKSFTTRQSKSRHENHFCKKEKDNKNNIVKINEENIELKETVKKLTKDVEEMKKNMKKANNKIINNNNGIINNNHIHINALGSENILNKLSLQEQINIATCHMFKESPHVEMVRLTYTKENCLENQNTLITNLQNKSCQVFNNKTGKFEATNKSKHIDNIIHYRKKDVAELSETLKNNKKVYKKYGKKLDPVEPIDPAKDKEEITYIIYNNRDKIKEIKKQLDNGELEYVEDDESEDEENDDEEEQPVPNIVL
jgi:hypothetical protein